MHTFNINICGGLKKIFELCTFMEYLGENPYQVKMLKLSKTILDGLSNCPTNSKSTEKYFRLLH